MYGGDEVGAIVIDVGTSTIRAGYAGEDVPKAVVPTSVGLVHSEGKDTTVGSQQNGAGENGKDTPKKKYRIGTNAISYKIDNMEMISPLENKLVVNWDVVEELLDHVLYDRLSAMPQEHPILFSEPALNSKENREKLCQLMFEKYKVPAFYVAKDAVLTAFSSGRSSALVLDSGACMTTAVPVHDGYVLTKSVQKFALGGNALSQIFAHRLENRLQLDIKPQFAFKKKANSNGELELHAVDTGSVHQTYYDYMKMEVVRDMKESVCRVSDTPFDENSNQTLPTHQFELPDGKFIEMGVDRFQIPEYMFQQNLISQEIVKKLNLNLPEVTPPAEPDAAGNGTGLPKLVYDAITSCDVDIRRDLYNAIVCTGGNTLFPGFGDRFYKDMSDIAPQAMKVKTLCSTSSAERKFSTWIGGSILASLGTFQQMWLSKIEYDEHGVALLDRKCS